MSRDFGTVGSRLIEWLSSTLPIMIMVAMNICFHLFQVNTWEMNSWTMERVLFLTAYKKSPLSKAVVPIYIFTFHPPCMSAPLFQIHPSSHVPFSAVTVCCAYLFVCVCAYAGTSMPQHTCQRTPCWCWFSSTWQHLGLNSHLSGLEASSFNQSRLFDRLVFLVFSVCLFALWI